VAAAILGGRGALRELGSRLVRWRVGWQWYVVAILGPAVFSLAVAGIYAFLGGSWALAVPAALVDTPLLNTGDVHFARSNTKASSFSNQQIISDAAVGFDVSLAVGADGAVYAAWSKETLGSPGVSNAILIDKSTDGGVSFGALSGGTDHQVQTGGIVAGGSGGVRPDPGRGNGAPYSAQALLQALPAVAGNGRPVKLAHNRLQDVHVSTLGRALNTSRPPSVARSWGTRLSEAARVRAREASETS
jgi:hypothetical protein